MKVKNLGGKKTKTERRLALLFDHYWIMVCVLRFCLIIIGLSLDYGPQRKCGKSKITPHNFTSMVSGEFLSKAPPTGRPEADWEWGSGGRSPPRKKSEKV